MAEFASDEGLRLISNRSSGLLTPREATLGPLKKAQAAADGL
jgi:hypothetical protein